MMFNIWITVYTTFGVSALIPLIKQLLSTAPTIWRCKDGKGRPSKGKHDNHGEDRAVN